MIRLTDVFPTLNYYRDQKNTAKWLKFTIKSRECAITGKAATTTSGRFEDTTALIGRRVLVHCCWAHPRCKSLLVIPSSRAPPSGKITQQKNNDQERKNIAKGGKILKSHGWQERKFSRRLVMLHYYFSRDNNISNLQCFFFFLNNIFLQLQTLESYYRYCETNILFYTNFTPTNCNFHKNRRERERENQTQLKRSRSILQRYFYCLPDIGMS